MSVHAVIAPPGLQKSVSMSAESGSHLRLGVQSEIFLTSPFVIPCLRFLVRNFFGLRMARLISPDQFPFRLQPIFEVVTEQSALGAVDLVRAIQNLFDLQRLPDRVSAKDHVLQFNFVCGFAM
jgi:hypothetical protein